MYVQIPYKIIFFYIHEWTIYLHFKNVFASGLEVNTTCWKGIFSHILTVYLKNSKFTSEVQKKIIMAVEIWMTKVFGVLILLSKTNSLKVLNSRSNLSIEFTK